MASGAKTKGTDQRMVEIEPIADRREHAKRQPPKAAKWPRTERRRARVAGVLARRQPDLALVLEDVHDLHNVGAILRTCDAVGVPRIHLVYTAEEPPIGSFRRTSSAGAAKWIDAIWHGGIADCFAALRADGLTIFATACEPAARDLYVLDLLQPTAIVLGNEERGLSAAARSDADGTIVIPMMGMVQSLNVSVAAAVVLYEALRQRRADGRYDRSTAADAISTALVEEWLKR